MNTANIMLVLSSTWQTLIMVFFSSVFSTLLGLPIGIALFITRSEAEGGLTPNRAVNIALGKIVNILRSFPFIILMILLIPLSRLIIGSGIGTAATIIPLSIAAAPFVARVVESALSEIDSGVIQAGRAMGSTNSEIIFKIMLFEAMPGLVNGFTLTVINLIGYSAMAGALGGGGLGDLAIRYGYQRFQTDIMIMSIIVIILLVEIVQMSGNRISAHISSKR